MIKSIIVYTLAIVGMIAIILTFFDTLTVTGSTMFGGTSSAGPQGIVFKSNSNERKTVDLRKGSFTSEIKTDSEQRMIIRNAKLSIEVQKISDAISAISKMATNSGGFIVSSEYYNPGDSGTQKSATMAIRVPSKGLDEVLHQLKQYSIKVVFEEVSGEDITDKFTDLESKKKNLTSALVRLNAIMNGAKETADVLKVFSVQTKLQQELDILNGRIQYYQKAVSYSRVTIQLLQDGALVEKLMKERNQWQLTKVLKEAYESLLDGLKDSTNIFVYFLITILPLIILWGALLYT